MLVTKWCLLWPLCGLISVINTETFNIWIQKMAIFLVKNKQTKKNGKHCFHFWKSSIYSLNHSFLFPKQFNPKISFLLSLMESSWYGRQETRTQIFLPFGFNIYRKTYGANNFFHKEIKSEDRQKRYSHEKKSISKYTKFYIAPLLTMVPSYGYL